MNRQAPIKTPSSLAGGFVGLKCICLIPVAFVGSVGASVHLVRRKLSHPPCILPLGQTAMALTTPTKG